MWLEAVGSTGTVVLPDPFLAREPGLLLSGEPIAVEHADSYRLELENFAAAVAGTEVPLLGREDALGQARVLDALLRSAAAGAPFEL